jgi:hypothetical protein
MGRSWLVAVEQWDEVIKGVGFTDLLQADSSGACSFIVAASAAGLSRWASLVVGPLSCSGRNR